jgi:malonyl CoA-acyl carrier protein transacylase
MVEAIKVAYVFTGQESHSVGMGLDLYHIYALKALMATSSRPSMLSQPY